MFVAFVVSNRAFVDINTYRIVKKGYSLIIKNGAVTSSLEKRCSKGWNRVKFKIYLNNPSQYWLKQNHLYKHIQMILEYLNTGCSHLWYIYFHQKVVNIHQRLRKISHYQYNQGYIYWNINFQIWLLYNFCSWSLPFVTGSQISASSFFMTVMTSVATFVDILASIPFISWNSGVTGFATTCVSC